MQIDFEGISAETRYKLLSAAIVPRPIAWVSTVDESGVLNAAPFSLFNMFGEDPPIAGFSVLSRSNTDKKDTGRNVRSQREFVINLVSADLLSKMAVTAADYPPDADEFQLAGLTPAPSLRVKAPRIAESRVSLECRLHQIVALGPRRSLVLGRVLHMHVRDDAVLDAERGWLDTNALELVGRMGGAAQYVRTTDIVEQAVPRVAIGPEEMNGAKHLAESTGLQSQSRR